MSVPTVTSVKPLVSNWGFTALYYNVFGIEGILLAQDALRRQQAVLGRRIAAGRGDGRARRRLARRERMAQRTAAERAAHDERRRLRQVHLLAGGCGSSDLAGWK